MSVKSNKKEIFNEFSKAKAPELMQEIINTYAKWGHHQKEFRESIHEARADSDKKFKSQEMKKLCANNGIQLSFSPPNQHEWNGLVEQHHGVISNQITSMFACARWIPEGLWPDAWNLAETLLNLHESHLPDVDQTKFESFHGEKPNWNTLGILPFGQPVMFQEISDEGRFQDKAELGAYVSPARNTVGGGIVVINWKTKRHIVTSTYKILKELPAQFVNLDPRHWEGMLDQEGAIVENPTVNEEVDNSVLVIPEVNIPTVHTMTAKKPAVIPVTTTPPLSTTQTNALPDIPDTPEIPTSSHNDGPIQLTIEPAIIPPISVTDPAAPVMVSSAQEPSTSDAPTSGIIEDILPKKKDVVKTTSLNTASNTRPKRNVGTYKDGPAKERQMKQKPLHNYHTPDWQYIKAVKKQKKKHGADNPTMTQATKREDWPKFQEAIAEEYKQMIDDEVYDSGSLQYKDLPNGHNLLGSMFTLTVKRNPSTGKKKINKNLDWSR
jgi:hypothetical protein